jgi:hypothetical protein
MPRPSGGAGDASARRMMHASWQARPARELQEEASTYAINLDLGPQSG